MLLVILKIKPVVVAQFFLFLDIPGGNDPYAPPNDLGLAVRTAGMIDETRGVRRHVPINVVPFV